jgi:hypothetical protein
MVITNIYAEFFRILLSLPIFIMSNFFTKLTSVMGAATLVAVSTGASLVSAASEFVPYAETLADNGVITAQSSESGYRLGDNVTRAEMAKVVANLAAIDPLTCSGTVYSDVGTGLGDLCGYVEALADAGVVSTASATFRPSANVSRAEMVKMILGALGETGSSVDAGYVDLAGLGDLAMYVNRANEIGCISDSSYFRPTASSSRGESFKVAVVCTGLDVDSTPVDPTPTGTGTTSTGTVAGAVSVSLEGQAMAQYVPMNASSVKVGTVKIMATADTTVSSLVITRSGLGDVNGVDSVQLTQNGVAVSDSRKPSTSSQSATVKFTTPMMLKAGQSAMVDVLVNLTGSFPNNQHQFAVTAVNTVNNSTVSGTPVTLGLLNTTSYTVGTITADSILAGSVTSGKANQLFATVRLTPNKDATINAFTLTKGAGEDYTKVFANVSAYFNGTKVGTVALTTDKLTVTGLNIARLSGEQASVELRGDIVYVGAANAAGTTFKIDATTDVSATEKSTGYAMSVTNNAATAVPLNLTSVDITITKSSTGTMTVAPGAGSVELYKAVITSDASFDVSNYSFTLTSNNGAANGLSSFSDNKVTIYVNGVDYEIVNSTAGSTSSTRNWTATSDRFRVEPGTPVTVRVVGNLKSNALAPVDYTGNFTISEVRNPINSTTSAVTKNQIGDKVTVKNGTVLIKDATKAPSSSRSIYANAELEVGRFAVRAEAENVTVRQITVSNTAVSGALWTDIVSSNSAKLIDVDTNAQISATVTVSAGTILFDNMSALVTKDTDRNFKVVVQTSGFTNTVHNQNIDIGAVVNLADKSSGGSAAGVPATLAAVSTTNYVVGVRPPSVTLTKKSSNVFLVTVTNVDSESDVTLNDVTAQVKPVASNNSNYAANFCLRLEGTSDANACGSGAGAVPGPALTLSQTLPVLISKNSSVTREIYVQSNFQDPIDLQVTLSRLGYNSTTESYDISAK